MEKRTKNIILIGFMGAGKSSIGRRLAKHLGWRFADTDDMVETQTGRKINDIFAKEGEAFFRSLETQMLRQLLESKERCVIAVGGGLPMQPENQPLLKKLGTVVFLEADIETLMQRLSNDKTRPKLQGGDLRERITSLMAAREATYQALADANVSTVNKSYTSTIKEILKVCD